MIHSMALGFTRTNRLLLLSVLFSCFSSPGASSRQDAAWKHYQNRDPGYCVEFPARWVRGEVSEGAGMFFETGVKKFSRPLGEMDVSALSDDEMQGNLSTVDYLQDHLEGLRKFERAERLEIVDKRETNLLNAPALFLKDSYYDPQDRATWVDEMLLARFKGRLYRLELECRADTLNRFEPVFSRFVGSFRFECNRKAPVNRP